MSLLPELMHEWIGPSSIWRGAPFWSWNEELKPERLCRQIESLKQVGGRKNILGPLHTPWGPGTGPDSFSPDHPAWTEDYCLTDHGLLGPVRVETLAECPQAE